MVGWNCVLFKFFVGKIEMIFAGSGSEVLDLSGWKGLKVAFKLLDKN